MIKYQKAAIDICEIMANTATILISNKKISEAKKLRDELDSLIETAEILNNKTLMNSIRRSEFDIKKGKFTKISSKKQLNEFFRR